MITFSSLKNQSDKSKGNSEEKNKGGILGGLGYVGAGLAAGVGSVGEGIIDLLLAGGGLLTGNVDYAKHVFKDNTVGNWFADVTEDFNPGTGWEFAGNVTHGLGQSSVFLLNLIPGLGQLGTAAFFAGVGSQGISSAAATTGDVGLKEIGYGIASGAVEGALEKAFGGMGKIGSKALGNITKTAVRKGLVGQVLSDAASEFGEEFASEYIDTFLQRGFQIDPNKQYSFRDALYAGAVGFTSGAVSAGSANVIKAIGNERVGDRIVKSGNSQTLVNTATKVADKLAAQGTNWDRAGEWIKALRGQVDAYSKLSESEKTGMRGKTILGEMKSSLFFAETQSTFDLVKKSIQDSDEQTRATFAEYINRSVEKGKRNGRDYTAADIAKDTDGVAWQLAIYKFVPSLFDIDGALADMQQESGIADVVAKAQNGEAIDGQYSFEGYAEDGKGMYRSNFPKGTPKTAKSKVILDYIQNVWSKNPINLKINENGETKTITAQFDPTYSEDKNVRTDASKLMGGNRHGTASDQRVTLDLADDYYQIASESEYNYSKDETGKDTPTHEGVRKWHYFVNDIYFSEFDGEEYKPYRVTINVKEKSDGNYVYSFSAEAQEGSSTPQTLHAVVNGDNEVTANAQPSKNIIRQKDGVVNPESKKISSNYEIDENGENSRFEAIEGKTVETGANPSSVANATASPRGEALVETSRDSGDIEGATEGPSGTPVPTGEFGGEVDLERAKRDAERIIEWERKEAPTVDELNRVRGAVKNFDSLSGDRQRAIVRMVRSGKNIDEGVIRGVSNIMAITNKKGAVLAPDVEIRFAEFGKDSTRRGIKTEVGGKTVIVLNANAKSTDILRGTIAHEIVHYLENRKGYKALAEYAMKHAKADKVAKVRETYEGVYEGENAEAKIEGEVVASVVAELLGSEKFLERYAQMGEEQSSVVKKIARFVKGIASSLKDKDGEASEVAANMMDLVDRALGSEVEGEKTGEKYSVIQKNGVYYTPTDEEIIKNHPTINGVIINDAEYAEGHTLPDDEYKAYRKSQAEKARKVVGTYTNKDTTYSDEYGLITAEFKTPAIRKGKSYGGIALYDILPYVPQIFENAVVINTKPDSEANTNIKGIVNLVGCAILNNKYVAVVKLNVKEYANDEAKIYDNRVIEIEELTVVDRVGHQEVKTSSDSTSSAVSSKYIIAKFREFVKNNDEKKSLTNSDIKNSTEQYDLDPEAVEREAERLTPKTEKTEKKKAESSTSGIKTGSAEAGRSAKAFRAEFGLNKKAEDAIRSKLEALEEVLIKGNREAYVEEYKKRVEEIFDIVRREGVVEVATDNSYRDFQTYMRGKKFRVDKRFRQNMGKEEWKGVYSVIRGRLASDKNTTAPHVDSLYAELNELFPDLFPSEIINVHDQLERIAKVMLDAKNAQNEEFGYSQLPEEWQSSIVAEVIDRINSFITRVSSNRDSLKIIKTERNELIKMLKKERSLREKMAREDANAAKAERARRYTKKEVAPAVEEIEALTDEQVKSLAKGFALEGMSGAQKDRIISDIYIALHEASAEGEAGPGSVAVKGIATRIAWDMVQSARIKGEDGKLYHLVDIYDEASVQAIASEYADVLYERFANMGQHTKYSYFAAEIDAAEEEFRRDRIDDNAIHKLSREVSYQGQQLRRLVETQKRGMEDEGIQKVTKILASVVDAKGNIVTSKVDEAIGEADRFFNMESGRLDSQSQAQEGTALTEFAYSSDANLKFMIDEFKRLRAQVDKHGKDRTGKFLDAQEMRLLGKILAGIRKTVTEYNKVFINERYVDIDKVASDGATDIVEYHSLDKKAKTKVGELFDTLMRGVKQSYFYNVLTPETTIEALEGFKIGGVLKTLYHDVRIHKQKAEHLAVQMKKPFADYLDSKENVWTDGEGKKHSFRDKLNKKMINYNGAELTLGEAIYLYMLTKRELTHAGLKENGYIVYDKNNQRRLKLKIEDVENVRNEIGNQLDDADKAFLKMAEEFFNKISTEVKNEADMRIFGYTNIEDGYYVPMIRDRYSRMQGVTDQRQSVGSIITVYNKSFNQNTVQNAKALEGKNIMSIINDHADGLADYSELYIPLKSFDRVYNKAVTVNGETRSIREILNDEVWNKTGSYLRDLFADIQGQNRKSDNVIDSMVGKLRSAWVNSVLGLNLKVVATQTTSFVAANQVIEAKYLMPAMKKFFGNQSELGARADKYSDIIEPRSFEMGALRAQGNIDKVMEWSSKTGFMINLMDRRVCLAVFHAAELKAQAQGAGAVGTVENAKAAAKIADEAIYTTQAMTSASERSALQRSKSEIARTLSMFTSDSVKNLSHFVGNVMKYQAHRARAKSDSASKAQYEAELKKDAKAIRRSAKTLVMTGVMLGLITQAFKYLYAKEEEEPEEKAKDLATDVISSTFNILPGVSDIIDKFVFDYDLSLNVFDVANDTIEDTASLMNMAGRAMAGEYVSGDKVFKNVFNFVKTVGAAFGAPIAPVERTVTGLLRRFFPSAIYGYDSMMSNPSYSADLKAAVESGDEELAEHILETIYKNEATGVYSTPELEAVSDLYQKGYTGVIPHKIGATVNDVKLDRKQRVQFEKIYGEASAKVNELIRSEYYAELDDGQRAKAIKNIYSLYYNRAASEVAGVEWSNAQAYSRLTNNLSALFAAQAYKSGLSPYKTLRGKEVSVKDQFVDYVENLGLSDADKLVVLYANGYRDAATKKKMLAYINALSISEDEKAKIAERLGFAVENGKVVEKKEELEVRAE